MSEREQVIREAKDLALDTLEAHPGDEHALAILRLTDLLREQEREPDAWEAWDAGAMWILDRLGHEGGRPPYATSREAFQRHFGTPPTEAPLSDLAAILDQLGCDVVRWEEPYTARVEYGGERYRVKMWPEDGRFLVERIKNGLLISDDKAHVLEHAIALLAQEREPDAGRAWSNLKGIVRIDVSRIDTDAHLQAVQRDIAILDGLTEES